MPRPLHDLPGNFPICNSPNAFLAMEGGDWRCPTVADAVYFRKLLGCNRKVSRGTTGVHQANCLIGRAPERQ